MKEIKSLFDADHTQLLALKAANDKLTAELKADNDRLAAALKAANDNHTADEIRLKKLEDRLAVLTAAGGKK